MRERRPDEAVRTDVQDLNVATAMTYRPMEVSKITGA